MAGPLIAMAGKYLLGKGLEAAGLPSGITNPMGYATGQVGNAIGNAVGNALGVPSQLITDPKGFVKDKVIEAARNAPSVSGGGEEGGRGEGASVDKGFNLRRRGFDQDDDGFKRGGKVKSKSKPKVSSASKRADGIAQRGKTKGRYI